MTINSYNFSSKLAHLLFACAFLAVYLTGEHTVFYLHFIAGLIFSVMLFSKAIWLFIAPDLSNIKTFNFKNIINFLIQLLKFNKQDISHNPLSSFVSIFIFIFAFLSIFSGFALLYIADNFYEYKKIFKEVHEICSNILLALVFVHIIGVLTDRFIFKNNTYKKMLNFNMEFDFKSALLLVCTALFSGLAFYVYVFFTTIPHYEENSLYKKECSSCHFLYPANLYTESNWVNIINNLDNHYGDDATISDANKLELLAYLVQNSKKDTRVQNIFTNFTTNGTDESITKLKSFEKIHKHTPKDAKLTACNNCHIDAASGAFKMANIRIQDDKNSSSRR